MTRSGPHEVTASSAIAPDGSVRVLLQLPDGYVLVRPGDARRIARVLLDVADVVEKIVDDAS